MRNKVKQDQVIRLSANINKSMSLLASKRRVHIKNRIKHNNIMLQESTSVKANCTTTHNKVHVTINTCGTGLSLRTYLILISKRHQSQVIITKTLVA
jgi:hypothetical protein